MNKMVKSFFVLLTVFLISFLASCIDQNNNQVNNENNSSDKEVEVTYVDTLPKRYEKDFHATSFDELNDIIMSQNSLYNDELTFYYNEKFLSKYNFTTSPNIENNNEFYYNGDHLDKNTYFKREIKLSPINRALQLVLTYPYDYQFKMSTPKDVLDKLNENQYVLASKYIERTYNDYYQTFYITNPVKNDIEFTYGLTYRARTIDRSYFFPYPLEEYQAELWGITESVDLCPNYLFPSFEENVSKTFSYYKPVVKISNFELITMFGRIYINDYAIDCMIYIRNSYNIKSIDQLLDLLEKSNFNDPVYEGEYGNESKIDEILEGYTFKYIFKQEEDDVKKNGRRYYDMFVRSMTLNENGELLSFEHGISFFGITQIDKNGNIINDPTYILDYKEIYEEYFNTFIEGLTEVKINYVNHNK